MSYTFSLFCLLFLFTACQTEAPQETRQEEKASVIHTRVSEELKTQYNHYYEALENPFPTHCVAELNKVNPADAAPLDTAFFVFREQLKEIVAEKNIFKLLKHVDPNIKVGAGGEQGLQGFIVTWDLGSEEKIPVSKLWPTLKGILDLGGLFTQNGHYFSMPYLEQCYPGNVDAAKTGAVIGAGVRMRSGPGLDTKVLRNLSYDLLDFIEKTSFVEKIGNETQPWIKVSTQDGVEGFIYGQFFRSPNDARAGFRKMKDGSWKMVSLLTGD